MEKEVSMMISKYLKNNAITISIAMFFICFNSFCCYSKSNNIKAFAFKKAIPEPLDLIYSHYDIIVALDTCKYYFYIVIKDNDTVVENNNIIVLSKGSYKINYDTIVMRDKVNKYTTIGIIKDTNIVIQNGFDGLRDIGSLVYNYSLTENNLNKLDSSFNENIIIDTIGLTLKETCQLHYGRYLSSESTYELFLFDTGFILLYKLNDKKFLLLNNLYTVKNNTIIFYDYMNINQFEANFIDNFIIFNSILPGSKTKEKFVFKK